MKHRIVVHSDGSVEYLQSDALRGLADKLGGSARIRRVSHVVPLPLWRRHLFKLLRAVFGEYGRVASWTRRWHCLWLSDLRPSNGPIMGPFSLRDLAIAAEEEWIVNNVILKGVRGNRKDGHDENAS